MTPSSVEPYEDARPYFSVIILLWNSNQFIQSCLNALNKQTFHDFEIILINNASPEPLPQDFFTQYPTLNINYFHLDHNLGFAGGNNYAAALAKGRFLVLLNSDAFPREAWLENVTSAIQRHPECFFASKLIMAQQKDRLDGEGDIYHISGLTWHKSYNSLISKTTSLEGEVFSACGAAAIYPKDAFDLVGGFDPDYFAYTEDIDLGFRLRLAGYKCIYLPTAQVYHIGSGSIGHRSEVSTYYNQRNMIWTFFKDMPCLLLVLLLPIHLLVNFLLVLNSLKNKQGTVFFRAKTDAFRTLYTVFRKRTNVHRNRKTSIINLLSAMDWNPFSPLILFLRK